MHYKTKQVVIFSLASYMNYSLNKSMCRHINKHSDIYLGQIALFNDMFLPFFVCSMLRICETITLKNNYCNCNILILL